MKGYCACAWSALVAGIATGAEWAPCSQAGADPNHPARSVAPWATSPPSTRAGSFQVVRASGLHGPAMDTGRTCRRWSGPHRGHGADQGYRSTGVEVGLAEVERVLRLRLVALVVGHVQRPKCPVTRPSFAACQPH